MKKIIALTALAIAATTASALEVGVRGVHNKDSLGNMLGVTVNQKFGTFGVEGAMDRSTRGFGNVNRWTVLGTYDLTKFQGATISAKAGFAHLDPSVGPNGGALVAGVGASLPMTKTVSLVADYAYQKGQERVRRFDGNNLSLGVKVAF